MAKWVEFFAIFGPQGQKSDEICKICIYAPNMQERRKYARNMHFCKCIFCQALLIRLGFSQVHAKMPKTQSSLNLHLSSGLWGMQVSQHICSW